MGPQRIALFFASFSATLKIISCQCDTRCVGAGCMSGPNPKRGKSLRPHQIMSITSCKSMCFEDKCSVGCFGPNCESYCRGYRCEAVCDGDYCLSACEGFLCNAWCQGRNCKIKENSGQDKILANDSPGLSPEKPWQDLVVVAVMPKKIISAPVPGQPGSYGSPSAPPYSRYTPENYGIYRPPPKKLGPPEKSGSSQLVKASDPAKNSSGNQLPQKVPGLGENSGGYQLLPKAPGSPGTSGGYQLPPQAPGLTDNSGVNQLPTQALDLPVNSEVSRPPQNAPGAPEIPKSPGDPAPTPISAVLPKSRSIYQKAFVTYGSGKSGWIKGPPVPLRSALRTSSKAALRTNVPTNELGTTRDSYSLSGVKLGEPSLRVSANTLVYKKTPGDAGTVDGFFNFLDAIRDAGDSDSLIEPTTALKPTRISDDDVRGLPVAIKRIEGSFNLKKPPHALKATEDSFNFGGLPAALRSYEGFGNLRKHPSALRSTWHSFDPRNSNAQFANSGSPRRFPGSPEARPSTETTGYLTGSGLALRTFVGTGGGLYVPPKEHEEWKGRGRGRGREDGGSSISSRLNSRVFKSGGDDRGAGRGIINSRNTGRGGLTRIIHEETRTPKKKKRMG